MTNKKKQAYKDILKAVGKNEDHLSDGYYVRDLKEKLEKRIKIQEICELFNISDLAEDSRSPSYIQIEEHTRVIIHFKEGNGYKIAWSDDDRQPEEEYLYLISFSTGAYIFGNTYSDFYPQELFQEFFNELKSYEPKYIDTANKSLYFSPEKACIIHEKYKDIFKKYQNRVSDEYKRLKAQKLRNELAKLEGATQ